MNDILDGSSPRGGWFRWGRIAVAMVAIGLLAAACSSSPSTANSPSRSNSTYAKALAYSRCMRAHGMTSFPDPNSNGTYTAIGSSTADPSNGNPAAKAGALSACRSLNPGGGTTSPQQAQATFTMALRFAQCMRAHGIRNFPDPVTAGGSPRLTIPSGVNIQSPTFQAAQRACQAYQPAQGAP
jgi:hypothetical protein